MQDEQKVTANQRWKKENTDQIQLRVKKGKRDELKIIASMHGTNVNRLFLDAVSEKYGIEL